jgi:probable O-glycosylation ligase (exosortase A-associated)
MQDDMIESEISKPKGRLPQGLRIDRRQILLIAFVIITIILAVIFPFIGLKMQLVLILLPLAVVMGVWILLNPYIGIFLFFLNEYVRPDFFFPFLRPIRITILIELVTLLSWIMHLISTRKRLVWPKFNWIFIGFMIVIASTVITAMNNRKAYDTFEAMAIYFMIYLISINVVDSMKRLNQLVWALFIVHFIFAIKGIMRGGYAGGALMGDENDFALAMNMMIPFAFFMFLGAKNTIKKFSTFSILVTLTLAVISSMSRGGWVGLMVTVIFCVIKSKKVFVGMFIMVVLSVAIISFAPQKYWDEVKTITDTREATAASRISYWKAAVRMFLDYPITGVGADNGSIRMPEYYIGRRDSATQWGRAFHGTLPQILAELGSLGIICYLLMVFYAIKYLNIISRRKSEDPDDKAPVLANAIMGSIISYLATATFLSTPYYPQLWTLYTLTMILVVVTKTDVSGKARKELAAAAGGRGA